MSWNQPSWNQQSVAPPVASLSDERVGAFLSKVYGWMFLGLLVTAVTAFVIASTPALIEIIVLNRLLLWGIFVAQIGVVI